MYITGSFVNQQGDTVTVHIVTGADRSEVLEIGSESSGLYFTDDPAEIVSEVNDTFDHLLRQSATIRLLARNFIPDFFSTSCRDVIVNIYKGDVCVFAGFIEPQTYSQPYNEVYDEIELNCIDALSALQYSKYKQVGAADVDYGEVKGAAEQRPFLDIMKEVLGGVVTGLDLVGGHTLQYLYDGSKAIDSDEGNRYAVFSQMSISELLFLGDEEDDVWRQDEVLEEMLRYLNLHIIQDGLAFYIFSWETVRADGGQIQWRDIVSGGEHTTTRGTVSISTDKAADCDTQISIGEVYNQLLLTCSIEGVDSIIESPLDADALTSPYRYKQKYMTEFIITGAEGNPISDRYKLSDFKRLVEAAGEMMVNESYAKIVDWYIQVKSHRGWKFRAGGPGYTTDDVVAAYCADGRHQEALPNAIGTAYAGAALLSTGSVEWTTDNFGEPVATVSMTDSLVLTNLYYNPGSGDEPEEDAMVEQMNAMFDALRPYAVYTGGAPRGTLSPTEDGEVNYIVFSGRIVLMPPAAVSCQYSLVPSATAADLEAQPCDGGKRYYTQAFHSAETPQRDPDAVSYGTADIGYTPPVAGVKKLYKLDEGDHPGMAALACMMVVGDKCLVEKSPAPTQQGFNYEWTAYKEREECADDDEYYAQCFYIRTEAKSGSYVVGDELEVLNTVDLSMGLDVEGMAVPVTKTDALNGRVEFKILRPVDIRYYAGFVGGNWGSGATPEHVMRHVASVVVKEFEVKIHTPSTADGAAQDNDVVYMSDTDESYVNRKDDIEFKINSALTYAECQAMGVSAGAKMSTPVIAATGNGVSQIHDHTRGEAAKAEQLYVDSYYEEYHQPRIILEQHLQDKDGVAAPFNLYRHPALSGKTFYVQGLSRNLIEGRADLMLKER